MLLLQNGINVYGEPIDLLVDKGLIQKIVLNSSENLFDLSCVQKVLRGRTLRQIDLKKKLVMPGLIDLHTHMRDPGLTHKEDFYTGSRSCAKGGITAFFDMPNTVPPTVTQKALTKKIKNAEGKSIVNFGFHFGASKNGNIEEIKAVLESGFARSTKVFLNVSTGEMLIQDKQLLAEVFKSSSLVFVHAEEEMIDTALALNARYGKGLYICHVSSEKEMRKLISAKKNPALNSREHPVYAEVTPHHLFLYEGMCLADTQTAMLLRMKPELKTKADNEFLLQALRDGFVDTVGTDHAPHTLGEKLKALSFGIPGTETSLALMLTAVNEGKIDLPLVQNLMCENPARIMNLNQRGKLAEGCAADIIVIDAYAQWCLLKDNIESKCGWSPYEKRQFSGKNYMTVVNGKIVYCDGKFTADAVGAGSFIFGGII